MRLHTPIGVVQSPMSPAARAVFERLVNGTFQVDLEGLADAMLDELHGSRDLSDVCRFKSETTDRTRLPGSASNAR